MLKVKIKEALKKSKFVLYFLCALSSAYIVLILTVIIEWIGKGIIYPGSIHILTSAALLVVLGCTYLAWNSIKHMETKLKSLEKVYLLD